jgi:N-acetylmuramoyl-L-alanine amidase
VTPAGTTGVAVIAAGGADLFSDAVDEPFVAAHEGLVMAVEDRRNDRLLLRTMCDTTAWVHSGDVEFTPTAEPIAVGPGASFADAVVIIDPGHGGVNRGAQGPTGLREEVVNLDIARRARDLLEQPHSVDWQTGIIYPGDAIPAVGRVWVTRTEGPEGADYEAGLLFRATLAGQAGAAALISIHNNAGPDGPFDGPGSEAFYMFKDPLSRRLGGLLVEEMRRSFADFDVAWKGDLDAGAKYRLQEDGETDYYGILRRALVPSVIAEGAFISSEPEERLLATPEFRQAYADAIYRALVRFVTTDDPGSGFTTPYRRTTPVGSGDARPTCVVPAQP